MMFLSYLFFTDYNEINKKLTTIPCHKLVGAWIVGILKMSIVTLISVVFETFSKGVHQFSLFLESGIFNIQAT